MSISRLDDFDTRKLATAAEWSSFGLYVLTKVLKVEEAVEAGLIYAYLATKFSTFSTKRDTFVKKMNDSKSMFKRNTNGAYFLTEEAENNMKVLIENSK